MNNIKNEIRALHNELFLLRLENKPTNEVEKKLEELY